MIHLFVAALLNEPLHLSDAKNQLVTALQQHREALPYLSGRVTSELTSSSSPTQYRQGFFVYSPDVQRCRMQGSNLTTDTEIRGDVVFRLLGSAEKPEGLRGPTARFGKFPTGAANPLIVAGLIVTHSDRLVLIEDLLRESKTPTEVFAHVGANGERRLVLRYPHRNSKIEIEFASEWNYLPIRSVVIGSFQEEGQKKSLRIEKRWSAFHEVIPGFYFPTQMVSESFHNDELASKSSVQILDLNTDEKASNRFPRFVFPVNAPVMDYIDKTYYFLKADGTREPITTKNGRPIKVIYDPPAKDEGQSPAEAQIAAQAALGPTGAAEPARIPWVWIGAGAAFILLVAVLYRRYRAAS